MAAFVCLFSVLLQSPPSTRTVGNTCTEECRAQTTLSAARGAQLSRQDPQTPVNKQTHSSLDKQTDANTNKRIGKYTNVQVDTQTYR